MLLLNCYVAEAGLELFLLPPAPKSCDYRCETNYSVRKYIPIYFKSSFGFILCVPYTRHCLVPMEVWEVISQNFQPLRQLSRPICFLKKIRFIMARLSSNSLCSPDSPGWLCISDLSVSAAKTLGLQVCVTTLDFSFFQNFQKPFNRMVLSEAVIIVCSAKRTDSN